MSARYNFYPPLGGGRKVVIPPKREKMDFIVVRCKSCGGRHEFLGKSREEVDRIMALHNPVEQVEVKE